MELGWCAVRFTGANAPVYKYLNPKGLKRYHLYYPSFYFVQWKLSDTRNDDRHLTVNTVVLCTGKAFNWIISRHNNFIYPISEFQQHCHVKSFVHI